MDKYKEHTDKSVFIEDKCILSYFTESKDSKTKYNSRRTLMPSAKAITSKMLRDTSAKIYNLIYYQTPLWRPGWYCLKTGTEKAAQSDIIFHKQVFQSADSHSVSLVVKLIKIFCSAIIAYA